MENPPTKPKRWPLALLVAFITGIVGAVMAVPVSDWAMEAHHVSSMEGGRACAAIALWAPLAFLIGFGTGFFISLQIGRAGFPGYAIKQGVSLLVISALVLAGGGLGYATADHPPVLNGQTLALDAEIRIPAKGRSIEDLKTERFEVALVVSASDRSFSDLRWNEAVEKDGFITVRAWAPLRSRNGRRDLVAGPREGTDQSFLVMRHASPKKIDEEWSEWTGPEAKFNGSKPAPEDQYQARYRVRYANEYSPSPTPTPTPQPDPTPAESPLPEDSPTPEA